jgi:hypothetical protein
LGQKPDFDFNFFGLVLSILKHKQPNHLGRKQAAENLLQCSTDCVTTFNPEKCNFSKKENFVLLVNHVGGH